MADDFLKMQDALAEKTRENIDLRYEVNDKAEEIENLQSAIDVETGFTDEDLAAYAENSPGETSSENVSDPDVEEHVDISEDDVRARLADQIREFMPMSEEATEDFIRDTQPVTVKTTRYDPPKVISLEEYNNHGEDDEGEDYAKVTLTYYPKAQVLLDEDQEPIDDVEAYVGWRALSQFGGMSGNADVVYVRNRRMETDFEVERETEADLPLHVQFGMPHMEFESNRAAGKIKLREEDE